MNQDPPAALKIDLQAKDITQMSRSMLQVPFLAVSFSFGKYLSYVQMIPSFTSFLPRRPVGATYLSRYLLVIEHLLSNPTTINQTRIEVSQKHTTREFAQTRSQKINTQTVNRMAGTKPANCKTQTHSSRLSSRKPPLLHDFPPLGRGPVG